MYRTTTGLALKKTAGSWIKRWRKPNRTSHPANLRRLLKEKRVGGRLSPPADRRLLYAADGSGRGLCIALSFAFGIKAFEVKDTPAAALMQIGRRLGLRADGAGTGRLYRLLHCRPSGSDPGLIGGMLAVSGGSGFIGGIIAGFLAGYVAKAISTKLKLPQSMEALKPILIIPLVSSLIVGLAMIYLIGKPVAGILARLTHWLQTMGTANAVLLGAILGAMMCTDMGGPVNKAAYAFGVGLLSTQTYAPMAAIMAAGMVPPLAMGIATLVARNKFDKGQREGGKAALVLGLCFISEGRFLLPPVTRCAFCRAVSSAAR